MRKVRSQTKIIATIGPACSSREVLFQMIEEGVDVFRLNFSHSNKAEHQKVIDLINELNKELNINIAILADLQGPKLRIGEVENNLIELNDGDYINFVTTKCLGTKKQLYMSYDEFPMDVKIGDAVLIDDGKIKLKVIETNRTDTVKAQVIYGGPLSSRKGVNLPNTKISLPSMTDEDISNAEFAIENKVDWIALSFVRSAFDVKILKDLIQRKKGTASVIAKIEKPDALDDLEDIIEIADAIMVARGDLGVEVPFDRVPLIQKKIVNLCISKAKPVIIATQMMESMITNFRPTRAEANDVANAVIDGADALMLSAETSVGKFPAITIRSMQKIIDWTENNGFPYNKEHAPNENTQRFLADAICYQACKMAHQANANAIITFTHSGYTAYKISSHRPEADIFAFTNNKILLKKMAMVWGVRAFYCEDFNNMDDAIKYSMQLLKEKNLIAKGNVIVNIGSTPLSEKGVTNMLKLGVVQ
ncbi:MAG: pyruvate kinase [Bacteroidales bacterium]